MMPQGANQTSVKFGQSFQKVKGLDFRLKETREPYVEVERGERLSLITREQKDTTDK
jgi:hypothetical protein